MLNEPAGNQENEEIGKKSLKNYEPENIRTKF